MGAKYSPCMRKDENIEKALDLDRRQENKTACCVNNDGSGCVQMQQCECSVRKLIGRILFNLETYVQ